MSPEEVAELTGWSKDVIYEEIRSGRLRARHKRGEIRKWWITVDDMDEWIQHGLWEEEKDDFYKA
jgi:excisionase family DNA binding protein